jgi:hypothetical protein
MKGLTLAEKLTIPPRLHGIERAVGLLIMTQRARLEKMKQVKEITQLTDPERSRQLNRLTRS